MANVDPPPQRVVIVEQSIRDLLKEMYDINYIFNKWAGKPDKPADRQNHINSRVAPHLVPNLVTPKDDLNPIVKLVTRPSARTTNEQNNIRGLVRTYWDQFKIEWNGGNGSWTNTRDILQVHLLPTMGQLEANPR
jgi:hypothetical protein